MAMVLYQDMRIFFLDGSSKLTQHRRAANAGHIFQADLITTIFHHLIYYIHEIVHSVNL